MRIAIIGTGNVGSALARAWSRAGHQVLLGTRRPDAVAALARETGATALAPAEAAQAGEVVVLALPWTAAEAAVTALGPLAGRVVIDCMNPLVFANGVLALERGFDTSGGEALAAWLPGARIVKTLNQVGADLMADAHALPHRPVMFMAGDDDAAKAVVAPLLEGIGFEALDAGDLTRSRLLEPFGMVWINQAVMRGKGVDWAFAAVTRAPQPA